MARSKGGAVNNRITLLRHFGLKSIITLSFSAATIASPSIAHAGYVRDFMDAHGSCETSSSDASMMLLEEHLPTSDGKFLGKDGADWTEDDLNDFKQVFAACLRRFPADVIGVLRDGEPSEPSSTAIQRKVDQRVSEIRAQLVEPAQAFREQQQSAAAANERLLEERSKARREAQERTAAADKDAAKAAARRAGEDTRTRREAILRQAEADRAAAKAATQLAESETPLLDEAEREAQAAHQARVEAEHRLDALRHGVAVTREKQEADKLASAQDQARRAQIEKAGKEQREEDALARSCSISAAQFEKVSLGMTLHEVRQIFGCIGTTTSSTQIAGVGKFTVYQWRGASGGESLTTFNGGRLITKSQSSLD